MQLFPDLYTGLEYEDFEMVRPLLFMANLQQEEGMLTRKKLQKAILKLAQVRAKEECPSDFLAYQKAIDENVGDVLIVAAERMDMLLREPPHFLKKKTEVTEVPKVPLVQQKKDMISFLLQHSGHQGHSWQPHRSGAQCMQCKLKVHIENTLQELKAATDKQCTAMPTSKPAKTPRMDVVRELIAAQSKPQVGVRFLKLEQAYPRCAQCRSYILARTNEASFEAFVGGTCFSGLLPQAMWKGHHCDDPERRDGRVQPMFCKGPNVDDEVVISSRLAKPCACQKS